ncbi:MAG: TIGR02147 family protein [Bdellovibrionota bacterium]
MLIEHLHNELSSRKERNHRYSLRAFAKSLEIDASTLSALLREKRPLSAKTAKKLIDGLQIDDPATRRRIFTSTFDRSGVNESKYTELDLAAFEVISSWEHFAILSLLEITSPRKDTGWICRALGLPSETAIAALSRLETLNLIARSGTKWVLTSANLTTTSNVPSSAVRKNNRQYIELSLASLERDSVEIRDITGITMAIDKTKIGEAQKLIKEFRRQMSAFLETGDKNSVYRLNVQLFPLTRGLELVPDLESKF